MTNTMAQCETSIAKALYKLGYNGGTTCEEAKDWLRTHHNLHIAVLFIQHLPLEERTFPWIYCIQEMDTQVQHNDTSNVGHGSYEHALQSAIAHAAKIVRRRGQR